MAPDAAPIAGFAALLERFYEKAGLHAIWEQYRTNYAALAERYHQPLAGMVFDTEVYLKLVSAGYLGRTFTVYLDFLGDPNEVDARNYGSDYYVVVFPSPDASSSLKMDQLRHTYLQYLLDPLAEKHSSSITRLVRLRRRRNFCSSRGWKTDRYLSRQKSGWRRAIPRGRSSWRSRPSTGKLGIRGGLFLFWRRLRSPTRIWPGRVIISRRRSSRQRIPR